MSDYKAFTLYSTDVQLRLPSCIASLDLSFEEFSILMELSFVGHIPPTSLIHRVAKLLVAPTGEQVDTELPIRAVEDALGEMLCKGFVQVVSTEALNYIMRLVNSSDAEVIDPDSIFPSVGDLDMTFCGADVAAQIYREVFLYPLGHPRGGEWSYRDGHKVIYSTDKTFAQSVAFQEMFEDEEPPERPFDVKKIESCGPWFGSWWRLHHHGWKIQIY